MDLNDIRILLFGLHLFAALSSLVAVYYAIKLYKETDKGWYWLSLVLSGLLFAIPQWLSFVLPFISPRIFRILPPIIDESATIAATMLFGLSCYGMFVTMKKIRTRVEGNSGAISKKSKGGINK